MKTPHERSDAEARTAKAASKAKVTVSPKLRTEINDAIWVHETIRQQQLSSKPLTHWVGLYEDFARGLRIQVDFEAGLKGGN